MAYLGKQIQYGHLNGQTITGNGSTATYALDFTVGSEHAIGVYVGNVHQLPGSGYNLASGGTQITFTENLANGEKAYIRYHGISYDTPVPLTDSVTSASIADDAVNSEHYVDGSIDTAHIADLQVTTAKIAADAITGAKIADDAIDSEHYTDGSIDLAHMSANSIDSTQYVDGSIDTAHIADDQVTLAKMAGLARGKIIYGDSSGNPAALALGSSNQVLTSDGTDIAWAASQVEESPAFTGNVTVGGTLGVTGAITGTLGTAAQTNITSLGTLSSLGVGAITSTAASTITTADNAAQLTLISTDTDANQGPILNLNRNPNEAGADNDYLGQIYWSGHNDAGTPEEIVYSKLTSQILDASDGTEDANMVAYVMKGGSRKDMFRLGPTETVFNEGGEDIDFRVESDGNANMLFVDAGNDRVGIGTASPTTKLQIMAASNEEDVILLEDNSGTDVGAIRIHGGAFMMKGKSATAPVQMQTHDGNEDIEVDPDGFIKMETAGSERLRIVSSGDVGIGTDSPTSKLTITKAGNGNSPILHVIDTADTEVAWFEGNRAGDTGAFIAVRHNPSSAAESNRSGIKFQADDDGGNVTNYARITQYIEDHTNTTEDGRLAINVSSDGSDNEVVNIRKDQFIYKGDAGSSFIRVDNRADGHDTGFEIYQNGSRKWEIHSDDSQSDCLSIRNASGAEKFRFLQAGGITFNGDTAAANALDDYEEGTFTPSYTVAGGGSAGTVTGTNVGTYTKIGNLVHCAVRSFYVPTSGTVPSAYNITLPFQAKNNGGLAGSGSGREIAQTGVDLEILIDGNATTGVIKATNGAAPPANAYIDLSFTYQAA